MVYTIKCSRDTGITQSINRSIDADLRCNGPLPTRALDSMRMIIVICALQRLAIPIEGVGRRSRTIQVQVAR